MEYLASRRRKVAVVLKVLWHCRPVLTSRRIAERAEKVEGSSALRPSATKKTVTARRTVRKLGVGKVKLESRRSESVEIWGDHPLVAVRLELRAHVLRRGDEHAPHGVHQWRIMERV